MEENDVPGFKFKAAGIVPKGRPLPDLLDLDSGMFWLEESAVVEGGSTVESPISGLDKLR